MHCGVRKERNMELELICPICGKQGYKLRLRDPIIKCDNCATQTGSICFVEGELITQDLLDKTAIYLFYHPLQEGYRCFLGSNDAYEEYKNNMSYIIHVLPEQVEAWYPRTFAQKIDCILLYVAERAEYYGQPLANILFAKISQEDSMKLDNVTYVLRFLEKEDYIEKKGGIPYAADCLSKYYHTITLTPKALARVDELQKDINNNKNIFVAISFAKEAEQTWDAITAAIEDKSIGFVDIAKKERIHNQQIMPHIMRLIRESRFLIMDITDPNYGAYYEAGYALGLGKEVIITCRKDVHDRKDFKCDKDVTCKFEEKALKPHFDIAQKQILVWEDTADLTKQLKEWILELSTRKR